jgi:hypothetical protein
MILYNHINQLKIESLIKALSTWRRAAELLPAAGRGPALPAERKISWAYRLSIC